MSNDYAPPAFTREDAIEDGQCNVFGHDFGSSPDADDTCMYGGSPHKVNDDE